MEDSMSNVPVTSSAALAVITTAEIDVQVATAHKFPRHTTPAQLGAVRKEVLALATKNEEVAADCFYAIPRDGKTVSGASIRFAEILASRWGNNRVSARVVAEERDHIVAEGVFLDLETNAAVKKENKRRITKKDGSRYGADMIATTGNAAGSIAMRGAILAGIPEAYWQDILAEVKKFIIGEASTLANKRAAMLKTMQQMGATEAMVLRLLDHVTVAEITGEDLITMRSIYNSIRDGERTVDQVFTVATAAAPTEPAKKNPATTSSTQVEETSGYAPEPTDEEKKAHKAKLAEMRKKVAEAEAAKKKEPATLVETDATEDFERDDAAATEQAAAEAAGPNQLGLAKPEEKKANGDGKPRSKLQQMAKDAADKVLAKTPAPVVPSKILIPIDDQTKCYLTALEPIPGKPEKGDLLFEGVEFETKQWSGEAWLVFGDQAVAHDQVIVELRRRSTKWFRSQKLDREPAMVKVKEVLELAEPPASMAALSLDQLVSFVASISTE